MNLVDRLKASHSFIGDPLHREAYEEIEELLKTLSECHKYISQYSKYEMRQYEMKHENNHVEEPNEAMWLSFKIEKLLGNKE
jgi:hypothetical protein